MVFPKTIEPPTEQGTTHCEQMGGSFQLSGKIVCQRDGVRSFLQPDLIERRVDELTQALGPCLDFRHLVQPKASGQALVDPA